MSNYTYTPNKDSGSLVRKTKNFIGSYNNQARIFGYNNSIMGTWLGDYWYEKKHLYVVYSYGEHFPIYIYDSKRDEWYGNSDKYSRSTSKHQNQAYPSGVDHNNRFWWCNTNAMQGIIGHGSLQAYQLEKTMSKALQTFS